MREIARNIAREAMKRAGYSKINKKRASLGNRSLFAIHWRDALKAGLVRLQPPELG